MKICEYCKTEIAQEAIKCPNCGEWVEDKFPPELNKFNWGAFLLNWIWGIMHRKYVTLLYFVACIFPIIGPLAISIWFGVMGNRWAWNSQKWESIEHFNSYQQKYVKIWFILFILGLILTIKRKFYLKK